ncbi:MAG: Mur ligase family protein [Planctomycetaceae bacterium]|nr:Mur ligase family protein [Planctomycetaceae bacterium]
MHRPQRCLLLGARGAGMLAVGEILRDLGHSTLGLDSGLDEATVAASSDLATWHPTSIPDDINVCISSPAVPTDDEVLQRVHDLQCPVLSLPECLGLVFQSTRQICVAGTHGKSTTSAMIAAILAHAELTPGYFVGAGLRNLGRSGQWTGGAWSVLESCEYQRSFHRLRPFVTVLTGIERDHFDCFPTAESEDSAFSEFAARTRASGAVVLRNGCDRSRQVAAATARPVITWDIEDSTANWTATHVRHDGWRTAFECRGPSSHTTVHLQVPGQHNVRNALAAIAAAACVGVPPELAAAGLANFSGIERRFQYRGSYGGMQLLDDYAHHPTAIAETLRTARQCYPNRRLIGVFEPHQMIRTESLFPEFLDALQEADEMWLLPVFAARENATLLERCRLSGQLVKELNRRGTRSFLFANLDQIVSRIDHSGKPQDVLLTMGAGRTNIIHDELNRRLQRHSVA